MEIDQALREGRHRVAFELLADEWASRLAADSRLTAEEAEDALQSALMHALGRKADGELRVVAPEGFTPRAWRTKVLRNHVIDQIRRRATRRDAEAAVEAGLDPDTHRSERRRELERRTAERYEGTPGRLQEPLEAPRPERPPGPPIVGVDLWAEEREILVALLPALDVRKRFRLCLLLRICFRPWEPALADNLEITMPALQLRLETVDVHDPDGSFRRVVWWPDGGKTNDWNNFSKRFTKRLLKLVHDRTGRRAASSGVKTTLEES